MTVKNQVTEQDINNLLFEILRQRSSFKNDLLQKLITTFENASSCIGLCCRQKKLQRRLKEKKVFDRALGIYMQDLDLIEILKAVRFTGFLNHLFLNRGQRTLIKLSARHVIDSNSDNQAKYHKEKKLYKGYRDHLHSDNTAAALFSMGRLKQLLMEYFADRGLST